MADEMKVRYLHTSEAARIFGVSPEMLRKLIRDGRLTGYRPFKGKGFMLSVGELEAHFAAGATR